MFQHYALASYALTCALPARAWSHFCPELAEPVAKQLAAVRVPVYYVYIYIYIILYIYIYMYTYIYIYIYV